MKYLIAGSLLALTSLVAQADEKTLGEKVRDGADALVEKTAEVAHQTKNFVVESAHRAGRASRAGWRKSKAYVSEESPVYHAGAQETLAALGREITDVKAVTPPSAPSYFRTRLLALEEQHQFLSDRLALLSLDQLRERSTGPRAEFDQGVDDLETAIDQAKDGLSAASRATPQPLQSPQPIQNPQ